MFNTEGDAIQAYYTYAFHINNDSSYIEFKGMNYPYYDNVIFAAAQPSIGIPVKLVSALFPLVGNYAIGIMNFLIIFSYVLCAYFLYLILLHYKVHKFLAVFGAFSITILSPQIFRLYGHYHLAYSFVIPLAWYIIIKIYHSQNKIKWSILYSVMALFWFFIHSYLGMVLVMFALAYWVVDYLLGFKKLKKDWKGYLSLIFMVFVPLLIFAIIVIVIETHINRPTTPVGLLIYNATWDTVFLPYFPPLRPILDKIHLFSDQHGEGMAYIGFLSDVIIIAVIFYSIILLILKKKNQIKKTLFPNEIIVILIVSVIFVLFSMAYPFRWGMMFILDWAPFLKQFRALGRFAWLFYFIITVYCVFIINKFYNFMLFKQRKHIGFFIVILLPLSYIYEGLPYHYFFSGFITKEHNLFLKDNLPDYYKRALKNIKTSKYQAIIPLPFFLNGSEWFKREATHNSLRNTLVLSYYTKLPVLGAMLSRTSMTEAKKELQVLAPAFYSKEIASDIKLRKPFLISFSNEPLTFYEQAILSKADLLLKDSLISLYEISYEKLFEYNVQKEIDEYMSLNQFLFNRKGLYTSDTTGLIYYNNFDNYSSKIKFRGKGCFTLPRSGVSYLFKYEANTFDPNKEYILSFWYNNAKEERSCVFVCIDEYDPQENKGYWNYYTDPRYCEIVVGDWSLVELKFKVYKLQNTGNLFIDTRAISNDTMYIDDLLIREANTNVYCPILSLNNNQSELFKNNHQILLSDNFSKQLINRENRVNFYIDQIKNTPDWLNNVIIQSKKRKINLEEMIRLNAEYMVDIENSNQNK